MRQARQVRGLFVAVVVLATWSAGSVEAQPNSQPNPYRTVVGWAKMPEGRTWGSTSAVEIDPDGKSIWVAERCGANTCAGSDLPAVLKFDSDGKLVTSFAPGMFVFPHGIHVDSATLERNEAAGRVNARLTLQATEL